MSNTIHSGTVGKSTAASTVQHTELGNPLPHSNSGLDWFPILIALIAISILSVRLGQARQKRLSRSEKIDRLIDKMEREEQALIKATLAAQQALGTPPAAKSDTAPAPESKPERKEAHKAPEQVAGAAPAAHASTSAPKRNLMSQQTAAESRESDAVSPRQDDEVDTSRPFVASSSAPIGAATLEAAVNLARSELSQA